MTGGGTAGRGTIAGRTTGGGGVQRGLTAGATTGVIVEAALTGGSAVRGATAGGIGCGIGIAWGVTAGGGVVAGGVTVGMKRLGGTPLGRPGSTVLRNVGGSTTASASSAISGGASVRERRAGHQLGRLSEIDRPGRRACSSGSTGASVADHG